MRHREVNGSPSPDLLSKLDLTPRLLPQLSKSKLTELDYNSVILEVKVLISLV